MTGIFAYYSLSYSFKINHSIIDIALLSSSGLLFFLRPEDRVDHANSSAFGEQHLKTSVALIELHKVLYGKYPESIDDLKFIGEWDKIVLSSVTYHPSVYLKPYYVEVELGWMGNLILKYRRSSGRERGMMRS